MPIPFGVSVGDFISGIQFINSVLEAADATSGSVAQYHGVVAALQSSKDALQKLLELPLTGPDEQAIATILERYKKTVTTYALSISGYERAFTSDSAKKWWRCLPKKVKWQRASEEKVQLFRSELQEHTGSLSLILRCIEQGHRLESHNQTADSLTAIRNQVEAEAIAQRTSQAATERCLEKQKDLIAASSSNVDHHLDRQDNSLKDQQRLLHDLSTTVDNGLVRQDSSLQRITAVVLKNREALCHLQTALTLLFICLMSMMRLMSRMLESVPQKLLMNGAVIFEDAHAFKYPIYTQFMDSWDAFFFVLADNFKTHQKPGHLRVARKMFKLHYRNNGQEVSLKVPFTTAFRPGKHVLMSMVFDQSKMPLRCCTNGAPIVSDTTSHQCPDCGFVYRFLADGDTILPKASNIGGKESPNPFPPFKGPQRAIMDLEDTDKPSDFSRVSINPQMRRLANVNDQSQGAKSSPPLGKAELVEQWKRHEISNSDFRNGLSRILDCDYQHLEVLKQPQ